MIFMMDILFKIFGMIFNPILGLFTNIKIVPIYETLGGTQRGKLIMRILADAALITIRISITSIVGGFFIGIVLALILISPRRLFGLRNLAQAYVDFFRSTPLLVQMFIVAFGLPSVIQGFGEVRFLIFYYDFSRFYFQPIEAATIALALNTGAYQAEIIRGGILSIPIGQTEAALGLGMTKLQTMRYIILPQALRLIIPPLTNEAINVILNSSLASVLSVRELFRKSRDLAAFYFIPFEIYFTAALFYFVITFTIAKIAKYLERKYKIPGLGVEHE